MIVEGSGGMRAFEDELGISQNMAKTPMIITLARIIMRAQA